MLQIRREWIDRSLSLRCKISYAIAAIFIRKIPRIFGAGSGRGFALIIGRVLLNLGITATPLWFSWINQPQLRDFGFAAWTTGILGSLMISKEIFNNLKYHGDVERRAIKLRFQVAALEANLHRELAEITNISHYVNGDKEREILQRILAAMADQARAHLRYFDDTAFQATLFLFDDDNCENFLCRARARDNRPVGHRIPCNRSVAYFWASGFPDRSSSVHDIKVLSMFPPRLSDGSVHTDYRSILILPLTVPAGDSLQLRGVITLDSDRRYEFWGAKRAELESLLEPHVRWILAIINDHPYVMNINGRS